MAFLKQVVLGEIRRLTKFASHYEDNVSGKLSSKTMTTDMFISTVRKSTRAKKLTPRMLNELNDRIEVYQAEKIDGEWVQKLTIHYNCVGEIFIPDIFPLPVHDVSVNTRKGVVVNYAPCQIAI